MKFRKNDWIDLKTEQTKYSYQVQLKRFGPWYHVMDGKEACIYDSAKLRDAMMQAHKLTKDA